MGWKKRLMHKIICAPMHLLYEALVAFGVMLGLYQGIAFFFPAVTVAIKGAYLFWISVAVSLAYGRWRTWKVEKIAFNIPHTNTTVEIIFADLFQQDGWKAIPVNEFFDSKIGKPVSDKSLHGILIEKHLKGKSFDEVVGNQLDIIKSKNVPEKSDGKTKRYPIGTTVALNMDLGEMYLAFALSKTHPSTCKAYCDVADMWVALRGLWEKARIESGGSAISVPLVGNGQSGVGLPARELLNLIVLSAIVETKKQRIASTIRVVLQYTLFEDIDLHGIKQHWKE